MSKPLPPVELDGTKLDKWKTLIKAANRPGHELTLPCREFPLAWTSADPQEQLAASHACHRCPIITLCADYADTPPREPIGVWGGKVYPQPQ